MDVGCTLDLGSLMDLGLGSYVSAISAVVELLVLISQEMLN